MAELAFGAVSSLLGVIRSEARLLGGVKSDVQFISEEMESMKSFLAHLSRTTAPPSRREHNEQVRAWMSQVRHLALDCNNCIDLYLSRINPDIYLARGGLRHYLLWPNWFLHKKIAQHSAAVQLSELKERARDIGKRRLRYGVEIPSKAAAEAGCEEDNDEEEEGVDGLPATVEARHLLSAQHDPVDYFNNKIANWVKELKGSNNSEKAAGAVIPSIAVVAPGNCEDACALAQGALASAKKLNFRTVMIDIPRLHYLGEPLGSEEILCYIWRELELEHAKSSSSSSQQQGTTSSQREAKEQHIYSWRSTSNKLDIFHEKRKVIHYYIRKNIQAEVDEKLAWIKSKIRKLTDDDLDQRKIINLSLPALLLLLNEYQAGKKKILLPPTASCEIILRETAIKFKAYMEAKELEEARAKRPVTQIYLEPAEYEDILREVFLQAQEQYTAPASTSALGEDQIEVKIREAKREILLEVEKMLEGKTGKKQATGVLVCQDEITQASTAETKDEIAEIEEKIKKIQQKIEATTKIKYIMNNIHDYLNDHDLHILIILYIGQDYILRWDETRYALSLLHCVAGAVIVTSSTDTQRAKEYCSPPLEPMECSTVGLYHNIVLELKRKQLEQMDEEGDRHIDSHVFRSILDECAPYEFTMKIFVHALYANPKRNNVQLSELHRTLQVSPKSLNSTAMKMIKFSYNNLPEEYKYCLVYLAIFPPGHQIRRSTLIQRWVAEGLITREDWPTSVRQAERCFDALTDHLLVCPADIGVTGEVKSCMVGNVIHQFIAKIAKKQGIMETRCLSHHFSIFNYLRLHSSETICGFLQKLSKSSQLSVLKVLDLEGCQCFAGKNKQYLKDICCKILLLKYLSLRRTNITHLPSDINNLHELEVLDIRQTDVPPSATRSFRLLKLKRLLAGLTGVSSVDIPEKVGNMEEMEVLSSVKPRSSEDLKDIGALWHLRKLGVVIEDKSAHLKSLLYAISFPRCLQSLTITLTPSKDKDTPSSGELPNQMAPKIYTPLKHLKSLSIRGTTINKQFLPLLFTNHGQLTKVTLNNTRLGQKDQDILADLPTLHYLRLRYEAYDESTLTFKKKKFRNLKYLLVEGSNITDISFDGGALELEKIVLTFTSLKLTGVQNLTKLWELELNNNTSTNITTTTTTSNFLLSIFKDSIPNIAKLTLRGTLLKQDDLRDFAKESNICCLMLLDKSYVERQLNFNKDEFPTLNLLILNCSDITNVSFDSGSAPKISKIVWFFKEMESLYGINNLQRLRELEFNGDLIPPEVKEDIRKHKNKPYLLHNTLENRDQATGNTND